MTCITGRSKKVRIVRYLHGTYLFMYALALDECLNGLTHMPSPSEAVSSSSKLAEALGGDNPDIHVGRPGGAPAVIFNPVLATLQRHLDHLEEVTVSRTEVERAAKYIRCAVKFYKDEATRQDAIREAVDVAIGENGNWKPTGNVKPDGSWLHDSFMMMILELKNTPGLSGDAFVQAVVDYSKIISRDEVRCCVICCSGFHG
jgi:hypothetical protein